jgi:hypothetical protein
MGVGRFFPGCGLEPEYSPRNRDELGWSSEGSGKCRDYWIFGMKRVAFMYIVIVSQSTVANGILVVVLWLSWRDYCVSTKLEPHLVGDLGLGNGVTSDEWNPP